MKQSYLNSSITRLVFFMVCMLTLETSYAQNIRNSIYGAKRKTMTEINKTKRDVRGIKRAFGSSNKTVDSANDTTDILTWMKKPHIPNSGMIHDYEHIYTFFHSQQEYDFTNHKDIKTIEWDSLQNKFYKNIGEKDSIDGKYEVIGWHPYWMEDAYKEYNYNLLTMLSLYSYDLDPYTGLSTNREVIDLFIADSVATYAKSENPNLKVLLSVTLFGEESNDIFLTSLEAQNKFIEEILEIMSDGNLDGINIDFEAIPEFYTNFFNHFIKKLNAQLSNYDYFVVLDVPYFNYKNILDYKELQYHVKYFNLIGYDFSGEQSGYPGSISPLRSLSNQPSLEKSVNDFLNLEIPPNKIILSLPLYGVIWDVSESNVGYTSYQESIPYYEVTSNYGIDYNPIYDPLSASFFYSFEDEQGKKICWFENDMSLSIKYDWLKSKKIRGVGLWALGYSQGAPEIWGGIKDNFGADSLIAITPIETRLSGTYGLAKKILDNKKTIGFGSLVFTGFLIVGFVLSLTDWKVRDILFANKSFRVIYSLIFSLMSLFGIGYWFNLMPKWSLIMGVIVGSLIFYLVNIFFNFYRKGLR